MAHPVRTYLKAAGHGTAEFSRFWFDQIGWLGYFFAQLEWASYWLAEEVGSPAQKVAIATKSFVARNTYATKEIVPNMPDAALRADWLLFFDNINACAEMRNDILHNPLEPNMEDIANKGVRLDQGIRLLRDSGGKVIELGDVQHYTDGLRELNVKMIDLMKRTGIPT